WWPRARSGPRCAGRWSRPDRTSWPSTAPSASSRTSSSDSSREEAAMRATSIIFRREMASYFRSPVGYLFAAIALFANGIWFQSIALGENAPKMSADILARFFFTSSLVTMVRGLALSFLAIAIERSQQNTIVLLNTSPVRDLEIILGKFFAAFVFLLVIVLVTLYI